MKRGVVYARLSEVRKAETEGIERQIREARAHAGRLDVEIVEELVDNDLTASKRTLRPAFERLMAGIASNEWDVVVLRSLDRWVRRPAELERIIETVEHSTVQVEAIHGEIDLRTRQGRMAARILTSVAMNEAEAITERVTDWHADRAARGLPLHGPAGYGFRRPVGARNVAVDPQEATRVREAAERVLAGEPLAGIARSWNRDHVPAPGHRWQATTIRRILLAPRVAGLRVHRGQVVADAEWPAILDRDTYDQVTRILTAPSRNVRPADARRKLLTGIITCGKCDGTLNSKPQRGKPWYFCRHCHGTMITGDKLDELVAEMVFDAVDTPLLADTLDRAQGHDTTAEKVAAIEALEQELAELAADLGDGRLTLAEWRPARAGIDRRITALRDELDLQRADDTLAEWIGHGGALRAAWTAPEDDGGLTVGQKRAIIGALFETIVIAPARRGPNRFDPERVEPKWRTPG